MDDSDEKRQKTNADARSKYATDPEKFAKQKAEYLATGNQNPIHDREPWSPADDKLVLAKSMPDAELSFKIGRSIQSIWARRQVLMGKTGDMLARVKPALRPMGRREYEKWMKMGGDNPRSNL